MPGGGSWIAKWNGSSWSTLGSGNSPVVALAVSGSDVYAGGSFTMAGGVTVNRIAKWNGTGWAALGSGMNNWVYALAVSDSDVYAGGAFTTAGGNAANYIAKWDGSSWSALGSGMNSRVYALAVSGSGLYAGGTFTTAGGKVSGYAAKANISGLPLAGRFSNLVYSPAIGFSCTFLDASVGQPYRIQTSPSLAVGSWTDFTNFTYTAPIVITVSPASTVTNKFFRAVTP